MVPSIFIAHSFNIWMNHFTFWKLYCSFSEKLWWTSVDFLFFRHFKVSQIGTITCAGQSVFPMTFCKFHFTFILFQKQKHKIIMNILMSPEGREFSSLCFCHKNFESKFEHIVVLVLRFDVSFSVWWQQWRRRHQSQQFPQNMLQIILLQLLLRSRTHASAPAACL